MLKATLLRKPYPPPMSLRRAASGLTVTHAPCDADTRLAARATIIVQKPVSHHQHITITHIGIVHSPPITILLYLPAEKASRPVSLMRTASSAYLLCEM